MSLDRKGSQMREDALLWAHAGYPAVAVDRYRDAADQIDRMAKVLLKCRDALPAINTVGQRLYNIDRDLDKQIEALLEPWRDPVPAEAKPNV